MTARCPNCGELCYSNLENTFDPVKDFFNGLSNTKDYSPARSSVRDCSSSYLSSARSYELAA